VKGRAQRKDAALAMTNQTGATGARLPVPVKRTGELERGSGEPRRRRQVRSHWLPPWPLTMYAADGVGVDPQTDSACRVSHLRAQCVRIAKTPMRRNAVTNPAKQGRAHRVRRHGIRQLEAPIHAGHDASSDATRTGAGQDLLSVPDVRRAASARCLSNGAKSAEGVVIRPVRPRTFGP
jgi:hypothetical protein